MSESKLILGSSEMSQPFYTQLSENGIYYLQCKMTFSFPKVVLFVSILISLVFNASFY